MKRFLNGYFSSRKLVRVSAIGLASLALLGTSQVAETVTASAAVPTVGNLGACTPKTGVIVYVDFSAWPKGPEKGAQDIACAPTPGATKTQGGTTSGLAAMTAAGVSTDGTVQYGEQFICRIGVTALGIASQEPDPAQESCDATPSDYWAMWSADAGSNSWQFSGCGAASCHPDAGSIEAWIFESNGGNKKPGLTPREVRAEETTSPVRPSLTIGPTTLKPASVGEAYRATLSTSGGSAPYTYALNSQGPVLPAGLSLSSSGVVSGSATAKGTVNFVVDVTAKPITNANPHLNPPDGYTGPNLGTIAVHLVVKS
jgi:Putative Ig domain